MNKYNIIAAAAGSLLLGACNVDDSNDTPLVELGARTTEFTVGATAGHVDIDVLTNRRCHLRFLEETPWAELSAETLDGDSSFYIDYDDNDDFPRMTRVLIEADNKLHRDTITLRQRGGQTPALSLPSGSLIVSGSVSGSDAIRFDTNIDFSEIERDVVYTSGDDEAWISGISYGEGMLRLAYDKNPYDSQLRTASVILRWTDGWNESHSATLYVMQKTAGDMLGRSVDFGYIRSLPDAGESVTVDEYVIIEGYIVSNPESGNAGENIRTTEMTIDYSGSQRTAYIESLDGKYGFMIETAGVGDNIFRRYDKVQILLYGTALARHENPERYVISGVTAQMVTAQEAGTAASIPDKRRFVSELTDDDVYTFVTLRDCEFPVRKGALTPIHDGYTNAHNNEITSKYPRLMRDIEGSSIYLYTNTTCPYRRDGRKLPYGSGEIGGVVVFELYPGYVYGDGPDEDSHGNIGRYQLRHMAYEDIRFDDEESFSALLTEYRYVKDQKQDASDKRYYWYPTFGANGRFSHSTTIKPTTYTTWNYIGPVGTKNALPPFSAHIGNEGYGMGIILEDGTDYNNPGGDKVDAKINADGKGQETSPACTSWKQTCWWDYTNDRGESWCVEFSTADIETDFLSMQFTVQGGKAGAGVSPIFWKAEWSLSGDLSGDDGWKYIGSYQVPDMVISSSVKAWQLGAYKQIDMPLPLEMLGHGKVYIRFTPERNAVNSTAKFAVSEIPAKDASSAMDYFAIRYNK